MQAPSSTLKRTIFMGLAILLPVVVIGAAVCGYALWTRARYLSSFDVKYIGDNEVVFDQELGFVRPKNATTRRVERRISYNIFTNDVGARVNRSADPTPKQISILTIGDSFSEGYGFENELTFTELLGKLFKVPVSNFSLGSYSAVQTYLSLKNNISLRPKVIIFGIIEDDLRRSLDPCAPNFFPLCLEVPVVAGIDSDRPYIKRIKAAELSGTQLSVDLLDAAKAGVIDKVLLGIRLAYYEVIQMVHAQLEPIINDDQELKAGKFILNRMSSLAEQVNATLIILYMGRLDGLDPLDQSKGWKPLPKGFKSSLPRNVIFVDSTPAVIEFYRNNTAQMLHLPGNEHPNPRAHELYAQLLSEEISTRHLLSNSASDETAGANFMRP